MPSNPTRRTVVTGTALFLAAVAAGLPPRSAAAVTPDRARSMVESLVADINGVIASGKSEAAMIGDFERIFDSYADVPTIARSALGPDARSASASELAAFTDAFRGYIARKYGKRFREFIGGRIEVNEAAAVNWYVEVRTTAYLRGENPFRVDFLVSDRSGRDAFFNMVIEGVNMLSAERVEIGAMLDRAGGDVAALARALSAAG